MSSLTVDSIALRNAGTVSFHQPRRGQRVTLDSVLLADFCRLRPRSRVLEPGTGTGIVSLLLARTYPRISITAVENAHPMAAICRKNVDENGLNDRITLLEHDIRELRGILKPNAFDAVVVNPPYRRSGTGRTSPLPERRAAREEQKTTLEDWITLVRHLKNRGAFVLVFSADRSAELIALLRRSGLEPKRVRFVHSFATKPAELVLVEAIKSGGTGVSIMPPLVVHEPGGGYSEEVREILGLGSP